jgi:hypothetical protein
MTKKLTLSIDEDVIDQAKELAAHEKTSVSALFTRVIRGMVAGKTDKTAIHPAVRKISGIAKLPKGKTCEDVLAEALLDKYGVRK